MDDLGTGENGSHLGAKTIHNVGHKIGQMLVTKLVKCWSQNWSNVGHKIGQICHKIGQMLVTNWSNVGHKIGKPSWNKVQASKLHE